MKNIQLVLIIAILILVYLISMQWLNERDSLVSQEETPTTPIITETPTMVAEETLPPPTTLPALTTEMTPTTEIPTETKEKNPELIEYKNANYGYHFSIPKKMYYAGFGARNGAVHTLAIQADALPENFGDAIVKVSYYGKKILPELQNTERYVDPNGKYILLLIEDTYSVRIEADNLQSPIVKAIEGTIGVN